MKVSNFYKVCTDCLFFITYGEWEGEAGAPEEAVEFCKEKQLSAYSPPVPKKFKSWEELDRFEYFRTMHGHAWKSVLRSYWEGRNIFTLPDALRARQGQLKWLRMLKNSDFEYDEPLFSSMKDVNREGSFGFCQGPCDCCRTELSGEYHGVIELKE